MDKNDKAARLKNHSLVGRWFHSFTDDGLVAWQGEVIAAVLPDLFLVKLYEWLGGEPSIQKLVPVTQMMGWDFYDSSEDMHYAYQREHRPRAERFERAQVTAVAEKLAEPLSCVGQGKADSGGEHSRSTV